ncbi:MAG: sulfatase-like hydrolase/transferase [Actinomycetota bacterium]
MNDRPARKNLLFILADQLQAFALGCMGHPAIRTPNLDALAVSGTLFTDAYVEFPVCTQYRGVLMTSQYGSTSGVTQFAKGPAADARCFADVLNDLGYWTSYVGKWHLYEFFDQPVRPEQRCGFDRFIGYQSHNDYLSGVRFWDEDGACREFVGGHRTTATADIAIERLREIPDERDFALFVSFLNPHYPLQPLPEYEALYADVDIPLRANVEPPESVFTPTYSPPSPQPVESDPNFRRYGHSIEAFWRCYAAMVTQLDHEIGRLLGHLREQGRDEDTLIIVTSDHGEMGGSHGRMNKGVWYEESVRVPMIVASPGSPAGASIATPVSAGVDILPTFLDWIGADPEPGLPGGSLVPMLDTGAAAPHHPIFSEQSGDLGWCMVRDGDHKYVAMRETNEPCALHDLAADPYEQRNLVADADEGRLAALRSTLDRWRRDVGLPT